MEKHVSHLLEGYVARQLEPDTARRVYQHLVQCVECRGRLALVEHVEYELDRAFRIDVAPSRNEKKMWWRQIRLRKHYARNFHNSGLIPVVICVLVLFLPFVAQRDTQVDVPMSPIAVPQGVAGGASRVSIPATEPLTRSATTTRVAFSINLAGTQQPLSTAMPPIPAPLAPVRP